MAAGLLGRDVAILAMAFSSGFGETPDFIYNRMSVSKPGGARGRHRLHLEEHDRGGWHFMANVNIEYCVV